MGRAAVVFDGKAEEVSSTHQGSRDAFILKYPNQGSQPSLSHREKTICHTRF